MPTIPYPTFRCLLMLHVRLQVLESSIFYIISCPYPSKLEAFFKQPAQQLYDVILIVTLTSRAAILGHICLGKSSFEKYSK
ncbi:uncharacterized protein F5147DRAFT_775001 [Suillus discolor]|uniref:Uncharacterized protein n=1 Tax=Suillus discolor TaxID=1912936 RepID=A0A9P7F4W4_9AGAM|nr:uncharacterized protein F5147DRAFT_775001 [Suillus discolor]KAG2106188.1 hypothetical protein F5147DRAFT_775001 [Suillus discolor]